MDLAGGGCNNLLVIRRRADEMLARRAIVMEGSTRERQCSDSAPVAPFTLSL